MAQVSKVEIIALISSGLSIVFGGGWFKSFYDRNYRKKEQQGARISELEADDKQMDVYQRSIDFLEKRLQATIDHTKQMEDHYRDEIAVLRKRFNTDMEACKLEKEAIVKEFNELVVSFKKYKG